MRYFIAVVVSVLCFATAASTQSPNNVPANQAFQVAADHDGVNTTGYRCLINGKQSGADLPASARVQGVVTCNIPALAPGQYILSVAAFNAFGTNAGNLTANTGVPPSVPTNLRVITVTVTVTNP